MAGTSPDLLRTLVKPDTFWPGYRSNRCRDIRPSPPTSRAGLGWLIRSGADLWLPIRTKAEVA